MFTEDRIKTFCSSSFDTDNMNNIMAEIGEMDVIIDDGLHTLEGNLQTLQILFPYLKEGGVYVIEDVNQENDWFVDDLLQDPRFLEVAKDYTVHDGFAHSFTRIIVIRK
jgi:cephalosporin hydroxylase